MKDYKRQQGKKELETILQKMIEADTVLLEWSDELWLTLIDVCVAHEDKTITFKLKNGYEITKYYLESVIRADFFMLAETKIEYFWYNISRTYEAFLFASIIR